MLGHRIPGRPSKQPLRMRVALNGLFYLATCLLLFVHVYVKFSSRGALGAEDLYGYGRVLAISEVLLISYLALNPQWLRKAPPLVALVVLWLVWVAGTCAGMLSYGTTIVVLSLLEVAYCPLLLLFFYAVHFKSPNLFRTTHIVFLLLFAECAAMFLMVFKYQNVQYVRYAAQLNDVYYLLLLLPWILLCPRPWWRYVGAGLIVVAVFWSMKRTALLALLVTLIVYFVTDRIRARSFFPWYWLVAIGVATYFSFQLYSYVDIQTDRFLSKRIESSFYDRGSGRIDIYNEVCRLLGKSTIDEWMLGHGHNTVRRFNTLQESDFLSAHNDWLEIVFDYGLLALALYLFIHISLLRFTFNLLKQRSFYGPAMAASYTLFLVMSLTSHLVLYASYFGYIMALWGSLCVIAEGVSPPCLIRTRAYGVKRA